MNQAAVTDAKAKLAALVPLAQPFAGQLTDQQIADVAAYVVQATGGS